MRTHTVQVLENASTWVISDGRAGNRRQALALARALGVPFREFAIELELPWRWLAPHARWPWPRALPPSLRNALHEPPGVALGCGRAAAFVTALLRERLPGCRAIQILDPRIDLRHFEYVVAPAHDGLDGANAIATLGALNPVDDAWLDAAATAHAALEAGRSPRLALLIGGPQRDWAFDRAALDRLLREAAGWQADHDGSLWLTTSRRTPTAFEPRLREFAAVSPRRMLHVETRGTARHPLQGVTANPYPGFLALADAFVVTADSVNLASEACATGKPVFVFEAARARGRLARFHAALESHGHARSLAHFMEKDDHAPWAPALREASVVADRIRDAIADPRRP